MHIENFQPGDVVTVLGGRKVTCPAGCCTIAEAYEQHKGRPLVVLAVDPPYVITANVAGPSGVVFDSRDVTLTKCSEEYLSGWKTMVGAHAVAQASCCPPETVNVRVAGHDGPGDAQPVG